MLIWLFTLLLLVLFNLLQDKKLLFFLATLLYNGLEYKLPQKSHGIQWEISKQEEITILVPNNKVGNLAKVVTITNNKEVMNGEDNK